MNHSQNVKFPRPCVSEVPLEREYSIINYHFWDFYQLINKQGKELRGLKKELMDL